MVFWKRSPLSLRNSVTFLATSLVRSSMHERAVEILGVVDAVLDLVAVAVESARFRAVALHVDGRYGP